MTDSRAERHGRFHHWQGQTLRARDFRDGIREEENLLARHNHVVHGGYGVSFGLRVAIANGHAEVECGLAYDCAGQQLVLQKQRSIDLPTDDRGLSFLVLRHTGYAGGREPVEAATELRWVAAARFRAQCGVPVARVRWDAQRGAYVDAAEQLKGLSAFRVPRVRALRRQAMAAGMLEGGQISWETLPGEAGLQVRVDTTAAGFISDRVMYLASLLWGKPNERFATPFASVVRPNAHGFTLRLLLPRMSAMAFEVVQGAGFVEALDFSKNTLRFSGKVMFRTGEDFVDRDQVARLTPCADLAWSLQGGPADSLTISDPDAQADFAPGDVVVAANLPRQVAVMKSRTLYPVTVQKLAEGALAPGHYVLRQGDGAPGSAARVVATQRLVEDGKTILWLESEITPALKAGEKLHVLRSLHTIERVSEEEGLTFSDSTPSVDAWVLHVKHANGDVVDISQQGAAKVTQRDGKIVLVPTLTLAKSDVLAATGAKQLTVVSQSPSQTNAFHVDRPELLLPGDLVRAASGAATAFVLQVTGNLVTLRQPLDPASTTLAVGDLGARTSVHSVHSPEGASNMVVRVGRGTVLKRGDLVTAVGPEEPQVTTVVDAYGTMVVLSPPIKTLTAGHVIAVAHFERHAKVTQVIAGAPRQLVVDRTGVFAVGDTLALIGVSGTLELSRVAAVDGATVTLRTQLSGLAVDAQIAVVSLRNASLVKAADGGTLEVAPSNFRAGDLIARFTHWNDATPASRLSPQTVDKYKLESWADGLLPRDAIGFAALSPAQPQLRTADDSELSNGQRVRLIGPHTTGRDALDRAAYVVAVTGDHVRLSIASGSIPFAVRPEELQVLNSYASQVPQRFAAYALERGMRIAWFGIQLPPAIDEEAYAERRAVVESCPLQVTAICACCAEASAEASSTASTPSSRGCCQ